MPGELLTLRETMDRTGLARRTLFRYRESGKFPSALRVGPHNILFKADDVAQWLRANGFTRRGHRDP